MKSWLCPVLIISALAVTGCDSGEDYTDDEIVQERTIPGLTDEFWNWFPWRAANGDLEIHRGTTTELEECLIFDLSLGGVDARATSGGEDTDGDGIPDGPGDTFEAIAVEADNQILDANGNTICASETGDQLGTFKLRDSDGTVLYTLFGDLVFDGDVTIPHRFRAFKQLIDDRLLFQIEGDQVFDGIYWKSDSEVLVTATENIERANPARQLVIAALVDGQCGSPGYDVYPDPP